MNITIFGSSKPQPNQPAYNEAYQLGLLLAQAGHTILTGGYMGTMEAASRGAAEAGGHVIGITCEEIERWRPRRPNLWVKEERRLPTLNERLAALIDGCDAAIALLGGPGTLAEIAVMWNRLIIASIPARPLVLVGAGWHTTFDSFLKTQNESVSEKDRHWLHFAANVQDAAAHFPPA